MKKISQTINASVLMANRLQGEKNPFDSLRISIKALWLVALVTTAFQSGRAQTCISGTWSGYWYWSADPTNLYFNGGAVLVQCGTNVTGSAFDNFAALSGTNSGGSFTFYLDYGRPDVYGTGYGSIAGDQMIWQGTDHYTGGSTTWTAVLSNVVNGTCAPVAQDQSISTPPNTPTNITLTANCGSGPLTYEIVGAPTNGTLSGSPPNVTYTPGFPGGDSFTFKANDGQRDSNPANVLIQVCEPIQGVIVVPSSLDPCEGDTLLLQAQVQGSSCCSLNYTWRSTASPPLDQPGSTNLVIPSVSLSDAGDYWVIVEDCGTIAQANPVTVTVKTKPGFSNQAPIQDIVPLGTPYSLTAISTGQPIMVSWFQNGLFLRADPVGSGQTSIFTIANFAPTNAGLYWATASNQCGMADLQWGPVNLGYSCPACCPSIVGFQVDPPSEVVTQGGTFRIAATIGGATPLYAQWFKEGVPIPGQTSITLLVSNATALDAGTYQLGLTNYLCSVYATQAVIITVVSPPLILSQPASLVVTQGGTATFTASANGTPPLSYQWLFNGSNLLSATSTILTLSNVVLTNAGGYQLWASNPYGAATSAVATLTVTTPAPPLAVALSGNQLTLSWPSNAFASFTLQATADLSTTNWVDISTNLTLSNGVFQLSIPATNRSGFYRLKP